MITRRQGMYALGAYVGITLVTGTARASPTAMPDPKLFQSGDFVWPKKSGTFVPYDAGPPIDPDADEAKWRKERDSFVAEVANKAPYFTPQAIERIRNLSYREFYAEYVGAQKPDTPGVYSLGGGIYVGHVGIIELDASGTPWVIEALSDNGVVRNKYSDWIAGRPDEMVWLGRATKLSASQRAKIPTEAKKQVGKPYDFWNFDLNDDTGFYCSKLAWIAVFRSLNVAIDGNANSKRFFWFSPKQLLYTPRIARLFDPGPYAL